jgi:DNA-binding NarL/FixJ family response regulator
MDGDPEVDLDAEAALAVPALRVALCDPRRWFREALAHQLNLEPDIRVLWTMATPEELGATPWVADVLVLSVDDHLGRQAVQVLTDVCELHPGAAVLGLTSSPEQISLLWPRVRRTGLTTLVSRTGGIPALVDELRRVAGGGRRLGEGDPHGVDRRVRALLSPREQEVLEWLAAGRTVSEIAAGLGVRPKTVANCKQRLYRKLGVHHQSHAVAAALSLGLLVPDVHDRAMAAWS